jgi:hypothetical protein
VDGEVAQLAALVISANHRLAHPGDPMRWFASQRAFARCGSIGFDLASKRPGQAPSRMPMAETPPAWLDQLARSGTRRVLLGFTRQDEDMVLGEDIPDRMAAGFAGGGSLWTMTTETDDGRALGWHAVWKAAYPNARDGRIWSVTYTATAAGPQSPSRGVEAATTELRHALAEMSEFAWSHDAKEANMRFTSALALLEGAPDPVPVDTPAGPADTLAQDARCLLRAAQRGWMFDDMAQWGPLKVDEATWRDHARRSEALYDAVTAAMVAAVNSSAPVRPAQAGPDLTSR